MKSFRFVSMVRFSALATLLLFLAGLSTALAQSTRHNTTLADLPQAAQSLISATLGCDDAKYQFQATLDGYRTVNASNTLRADFSGQGMRLSADDSQWTFALRGIGYGDALQAANPVAPSVSANRLDYARDTFIEWYVNGPAGLEQGWTLNTPPGLSNGDVLTLAVALEGNTRLDANGNSIALLRDDGALVLNYTGLTAYDATGRELRIWMETAETLNLSSLRIRVDDAGAQYPLTIDPWVQVAKLTASDGAAYDALGHSVAISGDG